MITVTLSLTAAVCWALHDFLVQPVTRRASAYTAMFWVLSTSTVILMAASLVIDGLPSSEAEWQAIGIAAFGGVLYVAGLATILHGLAVGNLSIVTPLVSLMGGVAALAAILLGERISTLGAVALPLAVLGAVLTSMVADAADEGRNGDGDPPRDEPNDAARSAARRRLRPTAGAGWGLLGALLFGSAFLTYSYAGGVSAVSAAAWGRLSGLVLFLPFALTRVPLRMLRPLYARAGAAACLDCVGYVAIAAALALGPVSVASALSGQFATVALLLGVVVLRERLTVHQVAGLLCTITAVMLFSFGA